ncbi:MAG: NAD-dependent epimerase/dehydratase family protein [Candidatus Kerfeldbacteria bacterium]|nr:NAD-dependent epimerase/dehydratase family protein [Candidatus Kerfeldbacteria bacterium]
MKRILVVGAEGQVGSELTPKLREIYGEENVVATDLKDPVNSGSGPFEHVDATDAEAMKRVIEKYHIDTVYHLVTLLSAAAEANPNKAWHVCMSSLKHVLDLAVEKNMERVFWPSSIAAFGPTTPKDTVPQSTVLEPTTMYGVTKVAGELLCQYYNVKYNLDVRSVRYPGLISWKVEPDGGTTDYGVQMFYEAIRHKEYDCYLTDDSTLPMMYMDDAVKATIDLMQVEDPVRIKVRTSYNLASFSFSPKELAEEIRRHIPDFVLTCTPEARRQKIANSWPRTIDDSAARADWDWKPAFGLTEMVDEMMKQLRKKLSA